MQMDMCMIIFSVVSSWLLSSAASGRLGTQSGPQIPVMVTNGFLEPNKFFENHVVPGIPVVFKGAATDFPAYSKWTDEYLKNLPESDITFVEAEIGKKENRADGVKESTFKEFLNSYKSEDIYLVESVPEFLRKDLPIYRSLNCEFAKNIISDIVMWFSSGGTRSVWHNDSYENINCLLRGRKELILADKRETKEGVHLDVHDGKYSTVDVDDVDEERYPNFKHVQFYNATIEAGDCVYIPHMWFHYVASYEINLAINVWWTVHKSPFDCPELPPNTLDTVTLRELEGDYPKMKLSEELHQVLYNDDIMYTSDVLSLDNFLKIVQTYPHGLTDDFLVRLFELLDGNRDYLLNYVELDNLPRVMERFLLTLHDEL